MTQPVLLNNRYILEKPLGSGGMAVVYRAHDQRLERTVAIKLLREDYSSDTDFRERFHQEAKAAANLVHPNIVTVHDFGMDGGRLYIVMEYVPGTNLNALLQNRGRFTVEEALPLIQQACAGIGYAHRAGLIHCDVKPHNLLITPDNRLKVTDFGIARAMESINIHERSELVWGSPQYFSPEQAAGKPPTMASDVYSLGVVLFYMLTGRLPFTAASATEMARMHRQTPPPSLRQFNPAIPGSLDDIVLKVLSKEPSQRYRTADQMGRVILALDKTGHATAPYRPANETNQEQNEEDTAVSNRGQLSDGRVTEPPIPRRTRSTLAAQPTGYRAVSQPRPVNSKPVSTPILPVQNQSQENPLDIDWVTLGLALLAVIAIGGLIPLWVWVYISYTQSIP